MLQYRRRQHSRFRALQELDIDYHHRHIHHFSSREYLPVDWNRHHRKVTEYRQEKRVCKAQETIWIRVNLGAKYWSAKERPIENTIQATERRTRSSVTPALFKAEQDKYWLCIWRVTIKCRGYRPSGIGGCRWRIVVFILQLNQGDANRWMQCMKTSQWFTYTSSVMGGLASARHSNQ